MHTFAPLRPWLGTAPLQRLGRLWVAIFGPGVVLATAAALVPPFSRWARDEPLLWAIPAGQAILLAASLALVRGRSAAAGAHALCVYKLLAGTGMLSGLGAAGGRVGAGLLVAAGGGAMDLGMGGVTWLLWRRSGGAEDSASAARRTGAAALVLAALVPAACAVWIWSRVVLGQPPAPLSRIAAANLAGACGGISAAALTKAFPRRPGRERI